MAVRNIVKALARNSFNSASLTGSFQAINLTVATEEPIFLLRIINAASTAINISYDGTTPHDYIPANGVLELNFQTNSQPNNYNALLAKGTRVYVSGTAGTGTIYLCGYFQPQQ